MKNITLFFFLILITTITKAQDNFDYSMFNKAKKYGLYIENTLPMFEVDKINAIDKKGLVYIPNRLRSSKYNNVEKWTSIKDSLEAYRVDIIFSKYPIRNGKYKMVYPLLINRIKNILAVDPNLNDNEIEWRIILQTECKNDAQVDSLFHGVRIYYHPPKEIITIKKEDSVFCCQDSTKNSKIVKDQSSPVAILNTLDKVNSIEPLPDSIIQNLKGKSFAEQEEIYSDFYQKKLDAIPNQSFGDKPKAEQLRTIKKLNKFTNKFKTSSDIVAKVMDRHPEWKNALVVADWTGSMYAYGGQILQWHALNFKQSGITNFTLFNDGDRKVSKKIGSTGGIYHQQADNVEKVAALYNLVMSRGGGGDSPENDVEAILEAEMNTDTSQYDMIILLADNNACVRDVSLYDRIQKPVKVILCGYSPAVGIDPDYLIIAGKTGGGIYTIDKDIENLKLEVKGKTVTKQPIIPLKIKNNRCGFMKYRKPTSAVDDIVFTTIDETKGKRKLIKKINLSKNSLDKLPNELKKMKVLKDLDLSYNNLKNIKGIHKNSLLFNVNLSHNNISVIPDDIVAIKYLKSLDLSNNQLLTFGTYIPQLKNLRQLNMSYNQISSLYAFKPLKSLEELNLSNNEIKKLPLEFYLMKKLKKIDLSGNQIEQIHENIYRMKRIEFLDLSNNNLSALPITLNKITGLKMLNLSGNPLSKQTVEVLKMKMPNTRIQF